MTVLLEIIIDFPPVNFAFKPNVKVDKSFH